MLLKYKSSSNTAHEHSCYLNHIINPSKCIYKQSLKITKMKKHPYHSHRVNESLLITVYPFSLVMFVISVVLFIQIKTKSITTYSNSSTMPSCHSCTASYIRNTFYIITKQHALEHKVTLFMLL